ncbi:flavonoid 3',5'-methyltransferase-like [Humulus lupulus]|uniref:flavonoid 3',5'-methyltransferase-like n=1 Tax=Humulus lupulus TaxID=3486 RepID=UPI002B4147AC|nr:flavonoid 3',5'-methyltransferase-like [Humulus lupulus]
MASTFEKNILKTPALLGYIFQTNSYPREHEQLKKLREATVTNYNQSSVMSVAVDGQLLSMLLKVMNAKKTIEVGVFTTYSLLSTALAIPANGHIITIDTNREAFEFGLEFIKKAGVDKKINFINSDAYSVLNDLINNEKEIGRFEFAFVDAAKEDFIKLLKLVTIGGVIAYDNSLWCGTVAQTLEELHQNLDDHPRRDMLIKVTNETRDFNTFIS